MCVYGTCILMCVYGMIMCVYGILMCVYGTIMCVYGIFVDYDSVCTILLMNFGNVPKAELYLINNLIFNVHGH